MTSVYQLISKVRRDLALDVDEATLVEWTGEALEFIGAVNQYEEAVAFVEVENYRAPMPSGMTHLIQIARNSCFSKEEACPVNTVAEIAEETSVDYVPLDCNGQPIAEYDLAYYRPYYDLIYEYQGWSNTNLYNRCFTPVRLSNHTFFNTIVCTEQREDILRFYQTAPDSYTIQDPYFILSFEQGQIAIAYRRVQTDENGWPMIPDDVSYMEAITRYVRYKSALRKLDSEMNNAVFNYVAKAEQDWHWYCKQAGNKMMMPKGVDGYEDLTNQKSYLLPQQHRYNTFFGRSNLAENRSGIWYRSGL